MSNIKHKKCKMRELAQEAKARLSDNTYDPGRPPIPKNASPQQRDIYVKLYEMRRDGEGVENPITAFGDPKKLAELSHEDKQRYILQLCSDYVSMRVALDEAQSFYNLIS